MKILLDENKKYFKANLHCHSTYSDGKLTVEQLKEEYKKKGYSIIAFTDHEHLIDNSRLNDDNFLAITAAEIAIKEFPTVSTLKNFNMRVTHLNFYALQPDNTLTPCYSSVYDHYVSDEIKDLIRFDGEYQRTYSPEGINDIVKKANESGFLVAYNHPTWSLENATDYVNYNGFWAVEIYNHSCSNHGRPDDEHVFDDMLRFNKEIFCTCADDNHNYEDINSISGDSFGGWIQVNTNKLDYGEVMQALKDGNFYASTGPEIYSLTKDGDKVTIKTSACRRIFMVTKGRRSAVKISEDKNGITTAEFTLRDQDERFRITVEDFNGKRAYTQSYKA